MMKFCLKIKKQPLAQVFLRTLGQFYSLWSFKRRIKYHFCWGIFCVCAVRRRECPLWHSKNQIIAKRYNNGSAGAASRFGGTHHAA